MTPDRALLLRRLWRRAFCAVGLHRWKVDRYWSLGGLLVDGRVCADCKLTHRERKVVWRPNER